jgi:hypothetical protein
MHAYGCPFNTTASFRHCSCLFAVQRWADQRETAGRFTGQKIHIKPTLSYSRITRWRHFACKHASHLQKMFQQHSGILLSWYEIFRSECCLSARLCARARALFTCNLSFSFPHKQKSHGFISGNGGGHNPVLTARSPNTHSLSDWQAVSAASST